MYRKPKIKPVSYEQAHRNRLRHILNKCPPNYRVTVMALARWFSPYGDTTADVMVLINELVEDGRLSIYQPSKGAFKPTDIEYVWHPLGRWILDPEYDEPLNPDEWSSGPDTFPYLRDPVRRLLSAAQSLREGDLLPEGELDDLRKQLRQAREDLKHEQKLITRLLNAKDLWDEEGLVERTENYVG